MIKISICIPTYNRAELLRNTLKAILSQIDVKSTEVIVSNNASTDNTENVVKDYIRSYPCIKYFNLTFANRKN